MLHFSNQLNQQIMMYPFLLPRFKKIVFKSIYSDLSGRLSTRLTHYITTDQKNNPFSAPDFPELRIFASPKKWGHCLQQLSAAVRVLCRSSHTFYFPVLKKHRCWCVNAGRAGNKAQISEAKYWHKRLRNRTAIIMRCRLNMSVIQRCLFFIIALALNQAPFAP